MIASKANARTTDRSLMLLALILTCLGILLVFDASYAFDLQLHISPYKYVAMQAIWAAIGVVGMGWAMFRPYWQWRSVAVHLVAASILLLMAVFVPHIGVAAKGAHRWVGIGLLRIQPSELAKLAVVLYVARACAGKTKLMGDFWTGPFPSLLVVGFLAFWTAVEPDLGTSLVIVATGLGALFFAGMKPKHLAGACAALLLLGGVFFGLKVLHHGTHGSASFQVKRLMVFLHPDQDTEGDGYQVYHSMIALGTGGFTGMGIGEGREKLYLPEAHTDFIFSVLGEEGGLIATLAMLALLVGVVARSFHIAATTKDPFGSVLAAGIGTAFGVQILINIGVVTSSMPATGVPLPFISYGGSSLVFSLFMVGILLNIARFPEGDPEKAAQLAQRPGEREFEMRWNRGSTLSRPEYRGGFGLNAGWPGDSSSGQP